MTKISFFNGLKEIGGTFVAIETENTKCMFDFGFAVAGRMDAKIRKRKDDFAVDYIRLGMLTPADGIYDKYTAEKTGLVPYGELGKECFFVISHMHIDHMGGLGCLHPDIPVYMSTDSLKLYRQLAKNGDVEHREHPNCIGVDYGAEFTVGDITVKCVPVDHDVVGACGFLITTPDGNVCYTGDYRFHGFHPSYSEEFGKTCHGADVVITEGVTASFEDIDMLSLEKPAEPDRTEEGLQEELHAAAQEDNGLIVVNPYNRNVERVHRMVNTFKNSGRTLVLDPVQADYVAAFYPEDEIAVYEQTYNEACSDSSVVTENKPRICREGIPAGWKTVSREELIKNPSKYALQLDYADMYELTDLKDVVSRYIHMDGAPLGAYDPSFAKMKEFLEVCGIAYDFKGLGGHAKPYYLRTMLDTIAPKTLIPLHSFRPEQVNTAKAGTRILPEYGDVYELKDGVVAKL